MYFLKNQHTLIILILPRLWFLQRPCKAIENTQICPPIAKLYAIQYQNLVFPRSQHAHHPRIPFHSSVWHSRDEYRFLQPEGRILGFSGWNTFSLFVFRARANEGASKSLQVPRGGSISRGMWKWSVKIYTRAVSKMQILLRQFQQTRISKCYVKIDL